MWKLDQCCDETVFRSNDYSKVLAYRYKIIEKYEERQNKWRVTQVGYFPRLFHKLLSDLNKIIYSTFPANPPSEIYLIGMGF